MIVKARLTHLEWDNYQGASGRVIEMEKLIELPDETKLIDVKQKCIDWLNNNMIVDDWGQRRFNGNGLISITIL